MDFHYKITIKGKKTIEFSCQQDNKNDVITGVEFKFNSSDETKERDRYGRVELRIYGKFDDTPESLSQIDELAKWSLSKDDIYREVTIVATTSGGNDEEGGNFTRSYHFDKIFCVDYSERLGAAAENDEVGLEFELFMAQAPTYKICDTDINNL